MVIGLAIVAVGVAILLDTLGVEVPWGIVLPSALVLVGVILLLGPRSGSSGGWVAVGAIMTIVLAVSSFIGQPFGLRSAENIEQADFVVTESVEGIIVMVDAGTVEVLAGEGGMIEVERQLNFDDERPQVDYTIVNGVLEIEADCPDSFFSIGSSCFVDHLLRVPASVDIEINSGAGSVRVTGLDGVVQADTGSGVIELVDLTGRVRADSGSGGVILDRIAATADVSTGSGSIRGNDVTSLRITAETGSGSIDLDFASAPEDVDLETGSGSVTIAVPAGSYRLDLDTNSGSTSFSGVTDDPASPRTIRTRTGSGSVRVNGE
jgi:hypothetical protein